MFKASSDQFTWNYVAIMGLEPSKHWYKHRAEEVMENQDTEIL